MIRYAALSGLVGLLLLGACNQAGDEAGRDTAGATAAAPASAPEAAGTYEPLAGTICTLPSGEEAQVLSVGDFDQNLAELAGLVAIEGRVREAYPARGALILVDVSNMAGCGDGCCPQAEVPIRLALEEYAGVLPAADSEVIVVGDLTVTDTGYELAVREIRRGEQVLISRAA